MNNMKIKRNLLILIIISTFIVQACDQNVGERQIIIKNKKTIE